MEKVYKILLKFNTHKASVFGFYMITNASGEYIEYSTTDKEAAKEQAMKLLDCVGYNEVRVVEDLPYYITVIPEPGCETFSPQEIADAQELLGDNGKDDIHMMKENHYTTEWAWGKEPEIQVPTYSVTFAGEEIVYKQPVINNIIENTSIINEFSYPEEAKSFHIVLEYDNIIDDCKNGLPEWIQYKNLGEGKGLLTMLGINKNYKVTIHLD